jgi:hypothetical protein
MIGFYSTIVPAPGVKTASSDGWGQVSPSAGRGQVSPAVEEGSGLACRLEPGRVRLLEAESPSRKLFARLFFVESSERLARHRCLKPQMPRDFGEAIAMGDVSVGDDAVPVLP